MKVPFPENEALFGIDQNGEKRWFCWRLPHGCRGKLAHVVQSSVEQYGFEHPMVEIDTQFHFDKGAWRLNRRGKSREHIAKLRRATQRNRQLTRIEKMQCNAKSIAKASQPHRLVAQESDGIFPTRIECGACGAMNRIPAPHGPIEVRAGAVLPTCTENHE
jgi:hypothetical protein